MGSLWKTSLSLFALFILAFIVVGFLLPRENNFQVSKSVQCSPDRVFTMINDLKNWETWSPWQEYDSNMKLNYSEISSGKDAWYTWDGNMDPAKGKLTILDCKANEKINMVLNFGDEKPANCSFTLKPVAEGTKITWSINIHGSESAMFSKFLNGYKYVMMKHFLEKDFNRGLDNINKSCQ